MRGLVVIGAISACIASPVAAKGGKGDQLAACMWSKMPTTTEAFVAAKPGMEQFGLFMKAAAECDPPAGNFNLSGLKKKLVATRPSSIGPDQGTGEGAFVCPRAPDGLVQPCKPAGQ